MKLTIFSQHFWPENFRINDIAVRLNQIGVKVNIFTGKPNYPDGIIKTKYKSLIPIHGSYKGIDILRFPIIPRGNSNFLKLSLNYLSFILSVSFFSFFYKKKFGNIFFVYATSPIFQALPAILIGKIFKIKTILWVQDLWPHNLKDTGYIKNSFILHLIDFFVNKIYNLSDLILCQSDAFTKEIKKKTKVEVKTFYNPSNYKFDFKKKINKSPYFNIYYTGNLGQGQNFDKIIKLFNNKKIVKEKIRLTIYGGGKNFDSIHKKIKDYKLKNVFLNKPVNPEQLKKKIKNADCFILKLNNGVGLSKTIPAKFQTYLSFGKPIVSINRGIVSKLVTQYKIGFQCNSEKSSDLVNILIKTKKLSSKQLKNIAINSQNLFQKKFEINNSCKKLKNYLEDI